MTTPLPSSRLSPTAGLFNAMCRHINRLYRARIADLNQQIAAARHNASKEQPK